MPGWAAGDGSEPDLILFKARSLVKWLRYFFIMKPKPPKIIEYIITSVIFITLAAWLVLWGVCWLEWWPRACVRPLDSMIIIMILAMIVTLLPVGLAYRERALRRARRGMWAGGAARRPDVRQVMDFVVQLVIDGPDQQVEREPGWIIAEERFLARGWWCWVEVDGGRKVWVDRRDFWQWLTEVEGLHCSLPAGESAISQRRWEPKLGRDLWMAYCDILEDIGAAECPTGDPRSRRYVPGQPWGRVEIYEKMRPSAAR